MSKVDMIITHYNEPWKVGKKLFDSIKLQECWYHDDINFVIVQDGEENALPWDELLSDYPFKVNIITLKDHSGVAAARNAGIDNAESDWIMFMDFDDMLADVATLAMFLRVFPTDNTIDLIWSKYSREGNDFGRFTNTTINCNDDQDARMIGKAYRVSFLNKHNIRFRGEYPEYSDMIFNTTVLAEIYTNAIRLFYAPFYPFYKKLRMDGAFSTIKTLDDKMNHQFARDTLMIEEMRMRGKKPQYNEWLIRTFADAYYSLRSVDLQPDDRKGITDELIKLWVENKDYILTISKYDAEVVLDQAQTENMSLILNYYNYFGKEYYFQNDMISFEEFMQFLDGLSVPEEEPSDEPIIVDAEQDVITPHVTQSEKGKRAVVYCGTKEVYVSMVASVKSLLATTHVDKVYFLIEDDEFPYEIPDIIETRNVKNTGLFDTAGPNFTNVWTYMCLMRTAYPQMFPEYDKVLSLDIDVVIIDDVGDLWDINLDDYYFAGVEEQGRVKEIGNEMYANFGVIMMNLDKLRRDGMGDKLIHAVNTEHFGCPEQDAFNKYCRGSIYKLPNDYNVTVYSHITGEPLKERILHYAGLKYWKHFGPVKKYNQMSWEQIMKLQEQTHGS